MAFTYPFINGAGQDVTAADVHYFLASKTLIARRIGELARQRFLLDFLLTGRYNAAGGGIAFTIDDELYSNDEPETIAPGGDYPKTTASGGSDESESTTKDGQDGEVFDESIARLLMDPVNRMLSKMVNRMVKRVDGQGLAKIASNVTRNAAAGGAWTSAEAIIQDVITKSATFDLNDVGLDSNTVVLTPVQFSKVAAYFVKADLAANGITDTVTTGVIPNVLGHNWVTSKHVPFADPFMLDTNALGGIGLEDLGSPGYTKVSGTLGIETFQKRLDDNDGYKVRVRRVGLVVILDPNAGLRITGTSI